MPSEQERGSLDISLKVGARVLVYGDIGEIQKVESLGERRFRYTILFEQGTRLQTYTSPPTTIGAICRTAEEIKAQVRETVIHGIGRYFGLIDERIRKLGRE